MKKLLIITFLLTAGWLSAQPDKQFSQYYASSLYLNPAFSGIYNDPSIHVSHRQQPLGPQFNLQLSQVSLIIPVKPGGRDERSIGGFGLLVFQETFGINNEFQRTDFYVNYTQNLKLGILDKYLISFAVQGGIESRQLQFSNLDWPIQYNPYFGLDDSLPPPSVNEFDSQQRNISLNAGAMYHFNPSRNYLLYKYSAFVGVSAKRLNLPNTALSLMEENREPILFQYNGGIEFKVNKLFVMPSLLAFYYQRKQQFNAGLNMAYVPKADRYRARGPQLLFGTWYKFRDSFIFMAGAKVSSISVRFSYDLNSNFLFEEKQIDLAQNSLELSIQYSLSPSSTIRKISNPLF
ncbi:MAG: PorP/SprF family type IX secretion system membrane protein [Bacteroidota bacterium]